MIHRISQMITDFLISQNVILEEEADIYTYGYETALSAIIDFVIVLVIGAILHHMLIAFLFFTMFITVRFYTGGFHASTYVKCKATFITILLIVLFCSSIRLSLSAIILIMLQFLISVYCLSPIDNVNKPLDKKEKVKYHRISVIYSFLWSVAAIIMNFYIPSVSSTIASTAFFITVLMIVEIYRKEENRHDED